MLSYCCINTELGSKKITTNRTIRKEKFDKEGLKICSELALLNLTDLLHILAWNKDNDIRAFRISSCLFPWSTQYNIEELPNYEAIKVLLQTIGWYIKLNEIRVSFHPDHFSVLASDKTETIKRAAHDINFHSKIFDLMELDESHYYPINIHVGTPNVCKTLKFHKSYTLSFS